MKNEILRRLSVLDNHKIPAFSAMQLRGGMQERLQRQEFSRYNDEIEKSKKKLKDKLKSNNGSKIITNAIKLEEFKLPTLRRVRGYDRRFI